jgi:hypothetical protein
MAISLTNHGFMCEWRPRVPTLWKCHPNCTRKPTLPWRCRRAVGQCTTCLSVGSYPFSFAGATVKPPLFRNGSARYCPTRLSFIVVVLEPQSTCPSLYRGLRRQRQRSAITTGFWRAVLLSPPGTVKFSFEAPSWVSTFFDPTLSFRVRAPALLHTSRGVLTPLLLFCTPPLYRHQVASGGNGPSGRFRERYPHTRTFSHRTLCRGRRPLLPFGPRRNRQ